MKNKLVKMFALMLCLVFVFSCTVFAADSPDTGNVTNSPSTGDITDSPDTGNIDDNNSGNNNTDNNNAGSDNSNAGSDNSNAGSDNSNDATQETLGSYAEGVTVAKVTFNGKELEATITAVSKDVADEAAAEAKKQIGEKVTLLKVFDLALPEGDYSAGVDVKINVPDVKAGQKISVLHQKADGTWEKLPVVKVEDGAVTATFTSFSPVAIVLDADTSVPVSPSTGSRTPIAVVGMMVLAVIVVGAGVVASSKMKTE